jgi:hypothetical protein
LRTLICIRPDNILIEIIQNHYVTMSHQIIKCFNFWLKVSAMAISVQTMLWFNVCSVTVLCNLMLYCSVDRN